MGENQGKADTFSCGGEIGDAVLEKKGEFIYKYISKKTVK